MPQSLAALYCHLVFSTKGREPWIAPEWEERLYAYIGGIAGERKASLVAAGGMPDHIHLLLSLARDWALSDLMRDVKARSSQWVHEALGVTSFGWQTGYGAFSVSVSKLDAVKRYLAGQKEHHATQTFQDEYREFLRLHGVEFDERYLWD